MNRGIAAGGCGLLDPWIETAALQQFSPQQSTYIFMSTLRHLFLLSFRTSLPLWLRRGVGGFLYVTYVYTNIMYIYLQIYRTDMYRKLLKAGNLVLSSTGRVPDNWQQNLSSRLRTGWGQTLSQFGPRKSIKNLAWTSHRDLTCCIRANEDLDTGENVWR